MQSVYLEVVREHPFATIAMYLYWKPLMSYGIVRYLVGGIRVEVWLVALATSLLLAALTVFIGKSKASEVRNAVILMAAAVPFAALPNMWAYAATQTVADLVLSVLGLVVVGAWAIWVLLIERTRNLISRASAAR
jgi:hypothetical protein